MKLLLLAISLSTATLAFAQSKIVKPVCKSNYIAPEMYTCSSPAHGLDFDSFIKPYGIVKVQSDWLKGGKNQEQVCKSLEAKFNRENAQNGYFGVLTNPKPVSENSKKDLIKVEYKYSCELDVSVYAFKEMASKFCGFSKDWYVVEDLSIPKEGARCLSCDDIVNYEKRTNCIYRNLNELVNAGLVAISCSDKAAIKAQLEEILQRHQRYGIKVLSNEDVRDAFDQFYSSLDTDQGCLDNNSENEIEEDK